ncbi:DMT family transporter [Streptomyces sp. J2-1]|uniref:DMT family transporter n=1 Tax=Streptomyces corallincola TaxID=2851888 RepID=UPI001C394C1D|nr:DMT family transporter [Streptomyces corallincola]MBV2354015.1 DMT family transporter [Streptomyces corallincola]
MGALTIALSLLAALSNACASVLQRLAAAKEDSESEAGHAVNWFVHVLRRPAWLAGFALLLLSTVLQGAALALGSLSVVQPLLTSELLFTLAVGSIAFHHPPDRRTWMAFAALGLGLALFLAAAAPSDGKAVAPAGHWLIAGGAVLFVVVVLVVVARLTSGAPRATLLGLAAAMSFSVTAALLKEVVGRIQLGWAGVFSHWAPYATAVAGLTAFLLMQGAFRAGSLTASQPALTLGDALTSVALGWALFDERIGLGIRIIPEILGVLLIGAGSLGLAGAPSVNGAWDTAPAAKGREAGEEKS